MCTQLVDLETLYKVRLAAPKPAAFSPVEARLLLEALIAHSTAGNLRIGLDEQAYWQAPLGEIQVELPTALSPKRAGLLCRALGLSMIRINTGFTVLWNKAQLETLCGYFNVAMK